MLLTGVQALDPGAGRIFLFKLRIVVSEKIYEQTAVVLDRRIRRPQKTVRIETVAVRFIIFLVAGIIYQERVRRRRAADNNAVHRVSLMVGARCIPVTIVVEISKREDRSPRALALVMTNTVNQKERRH